MATRILLLAVLTFAPILMAQNTVPATGPLAPTAAEQLFIYEVNRARNDPAAYKIANTITWMPADWPGSASYPATSAPPLAINENLVNSARSHSIEMAANGYFDHKSAITNDWPNKMALDAGYPLDPSWPPNDNYIEGIAAQSNTPGPSSISAPAGVYQLIHDDTVTSLGHRLQMLAMTSSNRQFREVGVGYAVGLSYSTLASGAYWTFHTGYRGSAADTPFLTGVVYNDANTNGRYDLGEGLGGITVSTTGAMTTSTTTNSQGGWAIRLTSVGSFTVTANGGSFSGTSAVNVTVGSDNVEVDFRSGVNGGQVGFVDTAPPGVAVSVEQGGSQASSTNTAPIIFDVTFAENVTGVTDSDIILTGSTTGGTLVALISGSGSSYTISVSGMTSPGDIIVSLLFGAATGITSSLPSLASTSIDNLVLWTGAPPTCTINQGSSQVDPATTGPIVFEVSFSESVNGFTASDLDLSASTTTGTLIAVVSGAGSSYSVSVTGMRLPGNIIATFAAGAATGDISLAATIAPTTSDNTVSWNGSQTQQNLNSSIADGLVHHYLYEVDFGSTPQATGFDVNLTTTSVNGLDIEVIDIDAQALLSTGGLVSTNTAVSGLATINMTSASYMGLHYFLVRVKAGISGAATDYTGTVDVSWGWLQQIDYKESSLVHNGAAWRFTSEVDFNRPFGGSGIDRQVIDIDAGSTPTSINFWFQVTGTNVQQVRVYERVNNVENLLATYNGTGGSINSSTSIPTSSWTGQQQIVIEVESNGGLLSHNWRFVAASNANVIEPTPPAPKSKKESSNALGCAVIDSSGLGWLIFFALAMAIAFAPRRRRTA